MTPWRFAKGITATIDNSTQIRYLEFDSRKLNENFQSLTSSIVKIKCEVWSLTTGLKPNAELYCHKTNEVHEDQI